MAESVDGPHAADERRKVLLGLYTAERAEQQTAVQQTLATIAAAVAYGAFVGNKLLSTECHVGGGCDGVADVGILLAPLPVLGLVGFLLNNQALIELRDRYIQLLEVELADSTPPGDEAAERFPSFVCRVLPRVYGPGERWYRMVTGVIWGLVAWAIAAALTVAGVLFADGFWGHAIAVAVYLVPAGAATVAAVETLWLNRGAERSPPPWLPTFMTWGWDAPAFAFKDAPSSWAERQLGDRRQASRNQSGVHETSGEEEPAGSP